MIDDVSPKNGPARAADEPAAKEARPESDRTPHRRSANDPPRFASGDLLAGRYRVVRFLARGGMAEVYEAEDLALGERVALKTLRIWGAADQLTLERFKREIQLARKVTHPNVCRLFELGIHPEGERETAFFTMELLAGETLAERLARVGPMRPDQALPLVEQMAAALAAAHDAGVVHRDFKTANVMLVPGRSGEGERLVVTDFGVACAPTVEQHQGQLTGAGEIVGSLAFMAPEQLEGRKVSTAADIYALGMVLYVMLTGGLPFPESTVLTMAIRRLHETVPSPRIRIPHLDRRWEQVIVRCLHRAPEDRFAKVSEVIAALRQPLTPVASTSDGSPPAPRATPAPPAAPTAPAAPATLAAPAAVAACATSSLSPATLAAPASAASPTPTSTVRIAALGGPTLCLLLVSAVLAAAIVTLLLVPRGPRSLDRERAQVARTTAPGAARLTAGAVSAAGRSLAVLGFREAPDVVAVAAMLDEPARGASSFAVHRPGSWVSVALAEVLIHALRLGGQLRVALATETELAKIDLSLAQSNRYTSATLARIGRRLDVDLAVVGALSLDPADGSQLRLDLEVQETRSGEVTFQLSERGRLADLGELAVSVGARLRAVLGTAELTPSMRASLRALLPEDPRATRPYAEGLSCLRRPDCIGAPAPLEAAIRLAPRFAGAHAALADAWEALGRPELASDEARRAHQLSARLPPGERALLEARLLEGQGKWAEAARIYATRFAEPDARLAELELETGLRLANAQAHAGQQANARATIARLRLLPAPRRDDPRIDLVEAALAWQEHDLERAAAAAARAAAAAEGRGARLALAQALVEGAWNASHQGDLARAQALGERAKTLDAVLGARRPLLNDLNLLSIVAFQRGKLGEALGLLREMVSIARDLGHQRALVVCLANAVLLGIRRGDLAAAERDLAAAEHVLEAGRRELERAALVQPQDTERGLLLFGRAWLADSRGDLGQGLRGYREAAPLVARGALPYAIGELQLLLGNALRAKGDAAGARGQYQQALARFEQTGMLALAAEARVAQAVLLVDEGRLIEGSALAEGSRQELQRLGARDLEALAGATVARAGLARGAVGEARAAIQVAAALSAEHDHLTVQLTVGIEQARIEVASASATATAAALRRAAARLAGLLARARQAGLYANQLEARLALAELELRAGPTGGKASGRAALADLAALAEEARARGHLRIAKLAAGLHGKAK